MKSHRRGIGGSVRYLVLIASAGAVLASSPTWLTQGPFGLRDSAGWLSRFYSADTPQANLALVRNPENSSASASAAELSMTRLLNGLLFSRPARGWQLETLKSESASAWLTQQSAPIVNQTSGNTLPATFFPTGFAASSPGQIGPLPADPNGGPSITGIWISNASGNWGTSTNWQNGTIPQGPSGLARFDQLDITTNVTVTNEVPRTIGTVFLGDTNGTHTYNITGATITFQNLFDGIATLRQTATSAGDTISAPILLANDLRIFNLGDNFLTLSGAISSSGPENDSRGIEFSFGDVNVSGNISDGINRPVFIRVEAGVVTLSGTNSYTRPTSIDGGTLLVNGDNSASTGTTFVRGEGSVLGGTGTIGGDVVVFPQATITGGTVKTVGALTLQQDVLMVTGEGNDGGTYLANLSGSMSDRLVITGQFVLGEGSRLDIVGPADGVSTYILATFGSHSDTFQFVSGLPENYFLVYSPTDLQLVPIPEPATWIGGGLALAACGWWSRRRLRGRVRAA